MLVYDSQKGAIVASYPIGGDVDDIFYDAELHRLYASSGEGVVSVFSQESPDLYKRIGTVATRKGARTSLFVPGKGLFFVAAPRTANNDAQLRVYLLK